MPTEYTIEVYYKHGRHASKWVWKVTERSSVVASGEVYIKETFFPRWTAIRRAKQTAKHLSSPYRKEIKLNTQETKQLTKRIEALEAELLS